MAVLVSALVTKAQQRCDMVNRNFVSQPEWIAWASSAYKELYDLLVVSDEDYYTTSHTFTIASGNTAPLPDDFFKLRGVDRDFGSGDYQELGSFEFSERNRASGALRYLLVSQSLMFAPAYEAVGTYRLWYSPRAGDLTTLSDAVDGVNGWEDYIVASMAANAMIKEESDASLFLMEKTSITARIKSMAKNRDMARPTRVVDVRSYDEDFENLPRA